MRPASFLALVLFACSGDASPAPATMIRAESAAAEPEPGPEPAPEPAVADRPALAEAPEQGGFSPRAESGGPTDAPPDPGEPIGDQPPPPTMDAAPPQDPNLDPDHLEQAHEQAMTDAEKRAARARAARHAYEQ